MEQTLPPYQRHAPHRRRILQRAWLWSLFLALIPLAPAAAQGTPQSPIPWKSLGADLKRYGFPMPPKKATLVVFKVGTTYLRKKYVPLYQLGFLLPTKSKVQRKVLVGTEIRTLHRDRIKRFSPTKGTLGRLDVKSHTARFGLNGLLVTALQCKARGWNALATKLWRWGMKHDAGHGFSIFYHPKGLAARKALAHVAWAYYANQVTWAGVPFSHIHKRMSDLLGRFPHLNKPKHKGFVKLLSRSVRHSGKKSNTPKGWLDALSEETKPKRKKLFQAPSTPYQRLEVMGFKAVPALLQHLDDNRLSRSVMVGFNNFPTTHRRVAGLVSDLLRQLSGQDLGRNWLRRLQGWTVTKKKALAWWKGAKQLGEERYLVAHVLPTQAKAKWPRIAMLRILTARYPMRLPSIYKTLLSQYPRLQSYTVAKAITASRLPKETKIVLFRKAAQHKKLEHVRAALSELESLDPAAFQAILIQKMKRFPRTPKQPYWRCREAAFAHLVLKTNAKPVWRVFTKVAKRVDVGLRMQFMAPMTYTYIGQKQKQERLLFLEAFLSDATVRDASSDRRMYSGPFAAMSFPKLEVRQFAAMQIASILGLSPRPDKNWTQKRWAAFRASVMRALKQAHR